MIICGAFAGAVDAEEITTPRKGTPRPAVEVNLEVLDSLSPTDTVVAPVVLRPPSGVKTKTKATAAATPAALETPGSEHAGRILFEGESTNLSKAAEQKLAGLAKAIAAADGKVELQAFAGPAGADQARAARRLAFWRAIAVRSFLIESGVRSARIDLRPLGLPNDQGPSERVDIVLLEP